MAGPSSSDTAALPGITEREREPEVGGHDRQVLVVGEGLAAAATAGFLEQAGLDPVLASPSRARTRSGVIVLWEPGLALLERIGLRRPLEHAGTRLDRLDCVTTGQTWSADAAARPSLVAIRHSRLGELLDRHLLGRVRTATQAVVGLDSTDTDVTARFERGVEEPFDAAVTTDRALVTDSGGAPATAAHTWEFAWPAGVPAPDGPTEVWEETAAAFCVPVADGTHVRLVATGGTTPAAAVSGEELADRFRHLFAGTGDPFGALDDQGFDYRRVPRTVPASLSAGRVVLAGRGARAHLPGSCLGPALGVGDAWVLADALAYGPASVEDALAAYERRRHRRASDLASRQRGNCRVDTPLAPPLREVCAARSLAFGHAVEDGQAELARAVPESL